MARDSDPQIPSQAFVRASRTAELVFAANWAVPGRENRDGYEASWVSRHQAEVPRGLFERAKQLSDHWWPTMGLIDYVALSGSFDDPDGFVAYVRNQDLDQFLTIIYNGDLTLAQVRALLDQPSEAAKLGPGMCPFSTATGHAHLEIFRQPEHYRNLILELVLASATPSFEQELLAWNGASRAASLRLQYRLQTESPGDLVESLRGKTGRAPGSFGTWWFVPSRFIGHRHVRTWGQDTFVLYFREGQVDLGSTEEGTELAEILKVLADRNRLEILRRLGARPSHGKELASSLGLTSATISRHLDQLKAWHLVTEDAADARNVKRLQADPSALQAILLRLTTYLSRT